MQALMEERRIVTVLFADVSGFTAMSESLDPEDVRAVMNDCFERLSGHIYAEGGVVDKYIGDNVMALFGVPKAREDDPVRAIRAALAMQRELAAVGERLKAERGFTVTMRIGLNSGLVVAGEVGSERKSAFTVMGDAVNLASRIEHHCRPGEVWVSRSTYLAARGFFKFERQAPIAVKGKREPQVFYRAVSEAGAAFEAAPFVGRDGELATLNRALSEALGGKFRLATISGEAGIGKSRLLDQFLKTASGAMAARNARLLRSAAFAGGGVHGLFAPLAGELGVALPKDGAQAKADFFLAFETALQSEARKRPVVLALEDAHFADSASWDLLAFLLGKLAGLPMLLLVLFRPEAEGRARWSQAEGRVSIRMPRLTQAESEGLVDEFLGERPLPKTARRAIIAKAGGHAFFLTEILRSLLESGALEASDGAVDLKIPENVQGVILARLDRLGEDEKAVLQLAACEGMEVEPEMLDAIEPALAPTAPKLQASAARRFLEPGPEGAFFFTHAILRDACYESLLKEKRRLYHRRMGAFWETHEDWCDRNVYAAADHYYAAREPGKAFALNWAAGQRSEGSYAAAEALRHYERALELLEAGLAGDAQGTSAPGAAGEVARLPRGAPGPERARIVFKVGDMCSWLFDQERGLEMFRRCLELIDASHPLWVETYRKIGINLNIRGEARQAEEMFVRAAEALGGKPVTPRTLALYYETATAFFRSGDNDGALRWIRRITDHYKKEGRPLPVPEDADIYALMPAFSELVAP